MDSGSWEADWLDLTAELLNAGWCTPPVERIAVQLATTLDSVACAFAAAGDVRQRCHVWQLVQAPDRSFEVRQPHGWKAYFRSIGAEHHLGIPVGVAPRRPKVFVLGRPTPYSAAEVEFTETLQRLLIGIDRHLDGFFDVADVPHVMSEPGSGLTPRETTVLALMATGLTAAAVARRLAIAERTVHKHLEHSYRKLHVSDCLSAVLRARRLGLLVGSGEPSDR